MSYHPRPMYFSRIIFLMYKENIILYQGGVTLPLALFLLLSLMLEGFM